MSVPVSTVAGSLDTPVREFHHEQFVISTDRAKLDLAGIHGYLKTAPWAKGISRQAVEKSIANSFCFGVYEGAKQIGMARVITDFVTFGYVCDFFILEPYRGRGLAKWLITTILECPEMVKLRRRCIVTHEAHGLYRAMGFMSAKRPDAYLELVNKDAYQ
jgi:GNAT superfamily N-acetyltransferase